MSLAKWFKVDFHVHTPESACFPDKNVDADTWLTAAKSSGINAVVITDHNSIGFLEKIDAVKEGYEKDNEFKVFYGIEVCVSSSYTHFIIIFNDSLTLESITDDVVQYLGLRRENWGDTSIRVSEDNLINFYKVKGEDIFIIPAHFSSNKGLGKSNVNVIKKYTQEISFSAIEVRNIEDVREYDNKVKINVIQPCAKITGSDNPMHNDESKHSLEGIGKMFTWIKTASLDFEGLRQVFIDPEYRVIDYLKASNLGKKYNPNEIMKNYISGMELKGFKHIDNMSIRFSPHFNCIIGSRGSGKSTFIESLRASLHGEQIFESKEILRKTLKKDGQITAYYNFGSLNPYKIKVKKDGVKKYNYTYENNDGQIEEPPAFLADIYSQKEIFSLVEDDNDISLSDVSPLIRIIDAKDLSEIYIIKDDLSNIITKLLNESHKILNFRSRFQELSIIKSEISTYVSLLKQFKDSGLEEKRQTFEKIQKFYKNEELKIKEVVNSYNLILDEVEDSISHVNLRNQSSDENNFIEFTTPLNESLEKVKAFIEKEFLGITDLQIKLQESSLNNRLKNAEDDYKIVLDSIKNINSSNISKIDEHLRELRARELELNKFKEEEQICIQEIENLANEFVSAREKLNKTRNSIVKESESENLKIEILPMVHVNRLIRNMQVEFGKEETYNNYFKQVCEKIVNPSNGYHNLKSYIMFLLTSIDGDINNYLDDECTEARFVKLWKDKKEKNTLSSLLNILPEDKVEIKICDKGSEIDINDGSPGQKCAAVLAFLLSNGKNPLIIDQPEDDLDNSLIYNLIVESIRKMKLERQIIIVSHNPNIPVLGDAEGIIILERNNEGMVSLYKDKKAGCIEEKIIRDGICDIMEGGEIAFKKREMKYMYRKVQGPLQI